MNYMDIVRYCRNAVPFSFNEMNTGSIKYFNNIIYVEEFIMKKYMIICVVLAILLWGTCPITAGEIQDEPENLYALSAVLMDADSGRVLFEKNGDEMRAMASTTKIMTCILALENAPGDDYVMVSSTAAAQPDVQLGIEAGEQYYLEDLLYAMMLSSYNDVAVAIAEHIGGTVGGFAEMMNEKARELGCTNTHFITPNGLDARDSEGPHRTTAKELAILMKYALNNQMFQAIAQKREFTFSDITKKKTYTAYNTNALFDMTEGVIAGKTGFTGDAGYCYVCAVERGEKTFIVSLLGCGWPGNKNYKWKDTMKLLEYADENYDYEKIWSEPVMKEIIVENAVDETGLKGNVVLKGEYVISEQLKSKKVLIKDGEFVECKMSIPETIKAPVTENMKLGNISFYLNGDCLMEIPIRAERSIGKFDLYCCIEKVFHDYFG